MMDVTREAKNYHVNDQLSNPRVEKNFSLNLILGSGPGKFAIFRVTAGIWPLTRLIKGHLTDVIDQIPE